MIRTLANSSSSTENASRSGKQLGHIVGAKLVSTQPLYDCCQTQRLSLLSSDLIYVEAWKSALAQCQRDLERDDHADALQVTSARAFRQRLGELKSRHEDVSTIRLVAALYPVLDHYEAFAASFVSVMRNKIGTSMMWGLLFLVVKVRRSLV